MSWPFELVNGGKPRKAPKRYDDPSTRINGGFLESGIDGDFPIENMSARMPQARADRHIMKEH